MGGACTTANASGTTRARDADGSPTKSEQSVAQGSGVRGIRTMKRGEHHAENVPSTPNPVTASARHHNEFGGAVATQHLNANTSMNNASTSNHMEGSSSRVRPFGVGSHSHVPNRGDDTDSDEDGRTSNKNRSSASVGMGMNLASSNSRSGMMVGAGSSATNMRRKPANRAAMSGSNSAVDQPNNNFSTSGAGAKDPQSRYMPSGMHASMTDSELSTNLHVDRAESDTSMTKLAPPSQASRHVKRPRQNQPGHPSQVPDEVFMNEQGQPNPVTVNISHANSTKHQQGKQVAGVGPLGDDGQTHSVAGDADGSRKTGGKRRRQKVVPTGGVGLLEAVAGSNTNPTNTAERTTTSRSSSVSTSSSYTTTDSEEDAPTDAQPKPNVLSNDGHTYGAGSHQTEARPSSESQLGLPTTIVGTHIYGTPYHATGGPDDALPPQPEAAGHPVRQPNHALETARPMGTSAPLSGSQQPEDYMNTSPHHTNSHSAEGSTPKATNSAHVLIKKHTAATAVLTEAIAAINGPNRAPFSDGHPSDSLGGTNAFRQQDLLADIPTVPETKDTNTGNGKALGSENGVARLSVVALGSQATNSSTVYGSTKLPSPPLGLTPNNSSQGPTTAAQSHLPTAMGSAVAMHPSIPVEDKARWQAVALQQEQQRATQQLAKQRQHFIKMLSTVRLEKRTALDAYYNQSMASLRSALSNPATTFFCGPLNRPLHHHNESVPTPFEDPDVYLLVPPHDPISRRMETRLEELLHSWVCGSVTNEHSLKDQHPSSGLPEEFTTTYYYDKILCGAVAAAVAASKGANSAAAASNATGAEHQNPTTAGLAALVGYATCPTTFAVPPFSINGQPHETSLAITMPLCDASSYGTNQGEGKKGSSSANAANSVSGTAPLPTIANTNVTESTSHQFFDGKKNCNAAPWSLATAERQDIEEWEHLVLGNDSDFYSTAMMANSKGANYHRDQLPWASDAPLTPPMAGYKGKEEDFLATSSSGSNGPTLPVPEGLVSSPATTTCAPFSLDPSRTHFHCAVETDYQATQATVLPFSATTSPELEAKANSKATSPFVASQFQPHRGSLSLPFENSTNSIQPPEMLSASNIHQQIGAPKRVSPRPGGSSKRKPVAVVRPIAASIATEHVFSTAMTAVLANDPEAATHPTSIQQKQRLIMQQNPIIASAINRTFEYPHPCAGAKHSTAALLLYSSYYTLPQQVRRWLTVGANEQQSTHVGGEGSMSPSSPLKGNLRSPNVNQSISGRSPTTSRGGAPLSDVGQAEEPTNNGHGPLADFVPIHPAQRPHSPQQAPPVNQPPGIVGWTNSQAPALQTAGAHASSRRQGTRVSTVTMLPNQEEEDSTDTGSNNTSIRGSIAPQPNASFAQKMAASLASSSHNPGLLSAVEGEDGSPRRSAPFNFSGGDGETESINTFDGTRSIMLSQVGPGSGAPITQYQFNRGVLPSVRAAAVAPPPISGSVASQVIQLQGADPSASAQSPTRNRGARRSVGASFGSFAIHSPTGSLHHAGGTASFLMQQSFHTHVHAGGMAQGFGASITNSLMPSAASPMTSGIGAARIVVLDTEVAKGNASLGVGDDHSSPDSLSRSSSSSTTSSLGGAFYGVSARRRKGDTVTVGANGIGRRTGNNSSTAAVPSPTNPSAAVTSPMGSASPGSPSRMASNIRRKVAAAYSPISMGSPGRTAASTVTDLLQGNYVRLGRPSHNPLLDLTSFPIDPARLISKLSAAAAEKDGKTQGSANTPSATPFAHGTKIAGHSQSPISTKSPAGATLPSFVHHSILERAAPPPPPPPQVPTAKTVLPFLFPWRHLPFAAPGTLTLMMMSAGLASEAHTSYTKTKAALAQSLPLMRQLGKEREAVAWAFTSGSPHGDEMDGEKRRSVDQESGSPSLGRNGSLPIIQTSDAPPPVPRTSIVIAGPPMAEVPTHGDKNSYKLPAILAGNLAKPPTTPTPNAQARSGSIQITNAASPSSRRSSDSSNLLGSRASSICTVEGGQNYHPAMGVAGSDNPKAPPSPQPQMFPPDVLLLPEPVPVTVLKQLLPVVNAALKKAPDANKSGSKPSEEPSAANSANGPSSSGDSNGSSLNSVGQHNASTEFATGSGSRTSRQLCMTDPFGLVIETIPVPKAKRSRKPRTSITSSNHKGAPSSPTNPLADSDGELWSSDDEVHNATVSSSEEGTVGDPPTTLKNAAAAFAIAGSLDTQRMPVSLMGPLLLDLQTGKYVPQHLAVRIVCEWSAAAAKGRSSARHSGPDGLVNSPGHQAAEHMVPSLTNTIDRKAGVGSTVGASTIAEKHLASYHHCLVSACAPIQTQMQMMTSSQNIASTSSLGHLSQGRGLNTSDTLLRNMRNPSVNHHQLGGLAGQHHQASLLADHATQLTTGR